MSINHISVDSMRLIMLTDPLWKKEFESFFPHSTSYTSYEEYIEGNFGKTTYYARELYFRTSSNWHPTIVTSKGYSFTHGWLYFNTESNLEIATITFGGFDDFSLSKDFIGFDLALEEWNKMTEMPEINVEWCYDNDFYFSN